MRIIIFFLIVSSCQLIQKESKIDLSGVWYCISTNLEYLEIGIEDSTIYLYNSKNNSFHLSSYELIGDSIWLDKNSAASRKLWFRYLSDTTLLLDNINDTLKFKRLPKTFKYNILWKPNSSNIDSDIQFAILNEAALRRAEIFEYQFNKDTSVLTKRHERELFFLKDPRSIGYGNVDLKEIWKMIDEAYPDSVYFPKLID